MSKFPRVKKIFENVFDGDKVIASCYYVNYRTPEEVARRIAAALNATRGRTTEQLESDDPLGYGELCREQREACADAVGQLRVPSGWVADAQDVILATPAPEPKENKPL